MNGKRMQWMAKPGLRLLLVSASAAIAGVCASGCVVTDTCEGDGNCPTGADDATASDTATGDDVDAVEGAADAVGPGDASDTPVSLLEGGADGADAGLTAPFLGSWTLTGTEIFHCSFDSPDASETADPGAIIVTFRAGPGPTDAGQVDLLFDDGAACALTLFVDRGVARLVSAPQICNLYGRNVTRDFTSVQVTNATGPLQIRETFTDRTACQYEIDGTLTPENG